MGFLSLFGRGRQLRVSLPQPSPVIGSSAPDAIGLGRYRDEATGEVGPRIRYGGQTGILLIGRNGGGKDTRICVPMLLQTEKISIFAIDPKGEMSAICAPWRRKLAEREGGKYVSINPYQLHADLAGYDDLISDGFDPLILTMKISRYRAATLPKRLSRLAKTTAATPSTSSIQHGRCCMRRSCGK